MKVTLVVLYNHHYPQNINRIERLYGSRFRDIVHLMPFYEGDRSNVIPVYENSYQFHGYIAQASSRLLDHGADHFVIIADDLILNPSISESSIASYFAIEEGRRDFIPELIEFASLRRFWERSAEALAWSVDIPGVEVGELLPSPEDAREQFAAHGVDGTRVAIGGLLNTGRKRATRRGVRGLRSVLHSCRTLRNTTVNFVRSLKYAFNERKLDFPLAGGYSDVLVISRETLPRFAQLLGIFAATDLFVEIAIPTALVLSSSGISTESDTRLKGRAYWGDEAHELEIFEQKIGALLANFPEDQLYVHPIKLSKWMSEAW